jgi:ComF family protein
MNLCNACAGELPWIEQGGNCLQNPLGYDFSLALFHYQNPIDQLISGLKFQGKLIYARILGELLAKKVLEVYRSQEKPRCIVPVPLHRRRLRERGFNQALEIARPLLRKLAIPVVLDACQRVRYTEAQSLISGDKRRENVKNAFAVSSRFHFSHVAIVDDVVTTSNTVSELCRVLRGAGVKRIDVWSCARTGFL